MGSATVALHCNCSFRAIASLACRIIKIPSIGRYGDFGVVAPSCLIGPVPGAFRELNKAALLALNTHASEAGAFLEFLGLAASLRDGAGDVIASLAISEAEINRLVDFAEDLAQ